MYYPLLLKPIYKETIWGGTKLNKNFNFSSPYEKTGEVWTVSCRKDEMSIVTNGKYKNLSLLEVINKDKEGFLGTNNYEKNVFPLLIKIIDTNDNLSIQVHPNNDYARKTENYPQGKNEMWYIFDAPENAQLIIGLKSSVTKEDFVTSLVNNTFENCLNYISVKAGDVIYIPAGLIHAITKGIVLLEIQQNSDITYRIYDYRRPEANNKPRQLHIRKALDTIGFSNKIEKGTVSGLKRKIGNNTFTDYISNKFFTIIKYDIHDFYVEESNENSFSIFSCISDSGKIRFGSEELELTKGNSFFLPAKASEITFIGKSSFIKSFV